MLIALIWTVTLTALTALTTLTALKKRRCWGWARSAVCVRVGMLASDAASDAGLGGIARPAAGKGAGSLIVALYSLRINSDTE